MLLLEISNKQTLFKLYNPFRQHNKEFNRCFDEKKGLIYFNSKENSSETKYRTAVPIEMYIQKNNLFSSKKIILFPKAFVQAKDENKQWKFVPNEQYLQTMFEVVEDKNYSLNDFPQRIIGVTDNKPAQEKNNFWYMFSSNKEFVDGMNNDYTNFKMSKGIDLYPPHVAFEKNYPQIKDYINKYK